MTQPLQINIELHSLVLFRNLLSDPVIQKLCTALETEDDSTLQKISACADFAAELLQCSPNFSEYLLTRVQEDENFYVLAKAQKTPLPDTIELALQTELSILQKVSRITAADLKDALACDGYLPEWETSALDFNETYTHRIADIARRGYGIFARYHTFMIQNGDIKPVRNPDSVRLSQLSGYELERKKVIHNTLALLEGKPAANALLYGDAGTGKSSTVKAIANEYASQGLRLIEISKNQLTEIPGLMDSLSKNPLKFILFIDDLSFTRDDDSFGSLKAILEGSVSAKTSNMVIYATSNRRHLVKETFSSRDGDDIHRNDTLEEMISLSARFGLAVTFGKPDKKLYTEIVTELAQQYGVHIEPSSLHAQAEAFALRRGGRSPRIARQFIEYLKTLEE